MIDFQALLNAHQAASDREVECVKAEELAIEAVKAAEMARARAMSARIIATDARNTAAKVIHDLLATKGDVLMIDNKGTALVYRAAEQRPGFIATQPIPGQISSAMKASS